MKKYRNKRSAHVFTKEVLFMALRNLLEEKPFDTITIKELTEKAGVSRTTFYRNYHSPEDVLIDYFREHPFGAFSKESYDPDKFELKSRIRDSLNELKANYTMWNSLFSSDKDFIFYRIYDEMIKTVCKDRAFDIGFRSKYELSAFVGIYFAICRDWIRGGMQESIDEMIDISYAIIHAHYKNDEYAIPYRDNIYLPVPPVSKQDR